MTALKELSREQRIEYIIMASLLIISVIIGIIVGMNEEWFLRRNFTAGYMAGALLSVILLFGIYRFIDFCISFTKNKK
ncbi:hypothetical protein [Alkalicoccus daliensis]|uniref:Uncharacterized protein n=1 Tax=Alkalicoccus daliensis TaxID=745820 RepID=A0A1H0I7W8_9BACI|nr:hypothetical protein [Alkalicoccus daliensis]SDO27201.1 hypothetical protein SAMN04488053_11027 [Alkalicoccus daliensis]